MAGDNVGVPKINGSNRAEPTETTPLISVEDVEVNEEPPTRAISLKQAVYLIAGELAGGGVLVLPKALTNTGWIGVPLLFMMCMMAAFNGKLLSDCWTLVETRDPELRTKKRNPYPIIAEQALGRTGSAIVSVGLVMTQFGISVVYLLLAAQIVEQLAASLVPAFNICICYLILACAMTPLLLFGSSKKIAFLGIVAFVSAVVACVLYFIQMMTEVRPFVYRYGPHTFTDFFFAVGMIMFAFGGASSFPTIQNDMPDRNQFTKSLQYSFIVTLALYLTIAIGGYAVLGESVAPNFAASLSSTSLTLAGNIFMVIHLLSAFTTLMKPMCQEVEERNNIPAESYGRRMLARLAIMLAILLLGEGIPCFYSILSLVGGTTIALLTYVLPAYCYIKLINNTPRDRENVPEWVKTLCWVVIMTGAISGAFATFSALGAMCGIAQVVPCFMR